MSAFGDFIKIELGSPIPSIDIPKNGSNAIRLLVCLHTQPLGTLDFTALAQPLTPQDCAFQIWLTLGPKIRAHLRLDGLPIIDTLNCCGIPSAAVPPCQSPYKVVMSAPPRCTVIVPTHDRTGELTRCLNSLMSTQYPNMEILVVDNAPATEGTRRLVQGQFCDRYPVRYLREDCLGGSHARNRGLAEATGDIVAFVDDDALVDCNWLWALAVAFESEPTAAAVSGMVLPFELRTPYQEWFDRYGDHGARFERTIVQLGDDPYQHPLFPFIPRTLISGNNMSYRTATLKYLGGFDPALGPGTPSRGGEDLAAYFQVISHGYRLVYEPAAIVYHAHRSDYEGLARQMYAYGVGLTAYLTKCVLEDPSVLPNLCAKAPQALNYLFGIHSPRNNKTKCTFSTRLRLAELRGMFYGPIAYAMALRASYRQRPDFSTV